MAKVDQVTGELKKSKAERTSSPVFDVAVQLESLDRWVIYHKVGTAVDQYLAQMNPAREIRWVENGYMFAQFEEADKLSERDANQDSGDFW